MTERSNPVEITCEDIVVGVGTARAVFLVCAAALVAAGWTAPVGYGTLAFQAATNVAVIAAVLRGRRMGAMVSMAFVGYDVVIALLVAEVGWRAGARFVTGIVLLIALAPLTLGGRAAPRLTGGVAGVPAVVLGGAALGLVLAFGLLF